MKKSGMAGTGAGERWRRTASRALAAVTLCGAGVAMPLGCIMPTPTPSSDSGVEDDAETPDATELDARIGDAVSEQTSVDGATDGSVDAADEDAAMPDVASEDATSTPDATTADAGTADAGTADAGTADAGNGDATTADVATADGDTPEGDATIDAESNDAALAGDASVVITSNGTAFPEGTCVTPADPQTLSFSNPGDMPASWTSSVTSSVFAGSPLATLVPSSGTVPPGQSMSVTLAFSLVSDPLPPPSFQIQIASGGSTTTLQYFETITGYDVVAPATVDFGDVFPLPGFDSDAFQTVNIDDPEGSEFGLPSPCAGFNLAHSGSSLIGLPQDFCVASPTGGANVTFEFDAPPGTPPGTYQATYTFVASPLSGPPCHSPPPIQLTANLLPPQDSGP